MAQDRKRARRLRVDHTSSVLDSDAVLGVLSFLPPGDIIRSRSVSRSWNQLVEEAPWQLWASSSSNLIRRHGHSPLVLESRAEDSARAHEGKDSTEEPSPSPASAALLRSTAPAGNLVTESAQAVQERCLPAENQGSCPIPHISPGVARSCPGDAAVLEQQRHPQLQEGSADLWKRSALAAEARLRAGAGAPYVTSVKAHIGRATCCRVVGSWVATGGIDEMVCLWDASDKSSPERVHHLRSPSRRPVTDVALSDSWLLASSGAEVVVWSRAEGRLLKRLGGHHQQVEAICQDDTDLAAACADGTVHLFDLYAGSTTQILRPHQRAATTVSCDAESSLLLSGGGDGAVALHDLRSSLRVATLLHPWRRSGWVSKVQLLPSTCNALAASSRGEIFKWDLRTMKAMAESKEQKPGGCTLTGLSVAQGAPVAPSIGLACSTDGMLDVVSLSSLRTLRSIRVEQGLVPVTKEKSVVKIAGSSAAISHRPATGALGLHGKSSLLIIPRGVSADRGGIGVMQPQGSQGPLLSPGFSRSIGSAAPVGLTCADATWNGAVLAHSDGSMSMLQFRL